MVLNDNEEPEKVGYSKSTVPNKPARRTKRSRTITIDPHATDVNELIVRDDNTKDLPLVSLSKASSKPISGLYQSIESNSNIKNDPDSIKIRISSSLDSDLTNHNKSIPELKTYVDTNFKEEIETNNTENTLEIAQKSNTKINKPPVAEITQPMEFSQNKHQNISNTEKIDVKLLHSDLFRGKKTVAHLTQIYEKVPTDSKDSTSTYNMNEMLSSSYLDTNEKPIKKLTEHTKTDYNSEKERNRVKNINKIEPQSEPAADNLLNEVLDQHANINLNDTHNLSPSDYSVKIKVLDLVQIFEERSSRNTINNSTIGTDRGL